MAQSDHPKVMTTVKLEPINFFGSTPIYEHITKNYPDLWKKASSMKGKTKSRGKKTTWIKQVFAGRTKNQDYHQYS